ncbi:MAG: hypothetical protein HY537_10830 [Deltaproteobacteria bacterium]|nr:hypothetical protein [Deltaproteobacteria bacterium]
MSKRLFKVSFIFHFAASMAVCSVSLPIHSLRDQGSTAHCWAYAMSNVLESRALVRQSLDFTFDIEAEAKYWVDYERMLYIYRTKKDYFLSGTYQGAWQIEFWESLLKHGKLVKRTEFKKPEVLYKPMQEFTEHLPFIAGPKPIYSPSYDELDKVKNKLRNDFKTEKEAIDFIVDYLNHWLGSPPQMTTWFEEQKAIPEIAPLVLEADYDLSHTVDSLVAIKPATDGDYKWVRFFDERYWGYRYDSTKVLSLIESSLDKGWPVTFANLGHAMAIMGYEKTDNGTFYAVADSIPGKITWYSESMLSKNLNFIFILEVAIKGMLPEKPRAYQHTRDYDRIDQAEIPPM